MAPHLLGADPTRIARIEHRLDQVLHGNLLARGAINMTLYDILGKVHGMPAYTFMGGMLHDRLLLPFGLAPWSAIGRMWGVPTHNVDAVIRLVSTMLGKDYFVEDLTVDDLGIRGMTSENVKALVS